MLGETVPPIRVLLTKAILSTLALLAVHLSASADVNVSATYDKALSAYRTGSYGHALDCLNTLEALELKPSTRAEVYNLRAVILMHECDYEAAETNLRKALELAPSLSNGKFNLAEIPFLNRNWAEARKRFEQILVEENGDLETNVRNLVRFKVFLTYLLERKNAAAEGLIKSWEQTGPMAFYAQAAIARNQGHKEEAKKWLDMAKAQFGESTGKLYVESFYEIGWEQRPTTETRKDFEISSAPER